MKGDCFMKIAICDDVVEFRKNIIGNLRIYFSYEIEITEFPSAEELLVSYKNGNFYDLVFMDVEMGKLNGIDAGIKLRKCDKRVIIIFVSNFPKYAIPAYDCEPLYFILKPIETVTFNKVMDKATEKYRLLHSHYIIKNRGEVTKIPIQEILYVEIYRKHLIFHTNFKEYETMGRLTEALNKLEPHGFCQVHQGFLVNMNHINGFNNYDVLIDNGEKVMVSVRKKAQVLKIYADYLERIY